MTITDTEFIMGSIKARRGAQPSQTWTMAAPVLDHRGYRQQRKAWPNLTQQYKWSWSGKCRCWHIISRDSYPHKSQKQETSSCWSWITWVKTGEWDSLLRTVFLTRDLPFMMLEILKFLKWRFSPPDENRSSRDTGRAEKGLNPPLIHSP